MQKPPHPHPTLGDIKLRFLERFKRWKSWFPLPAEKGAALGSPRLQTDSQIWLCWFNTAHHGSFSSASRRAGACPPKFTSANTQFSFNRWRLQVTRLCVQLYRGNSHRAPAAHQAPCHGLTAPFRYRQLHFHGIAP